MIKKGVWCGVKQQMRDRIDWRCDAIDERSGWLGDIKICELVVSYFGCLGVCSINWLLPGVPTKTKPIQYTQFAALRDDAEESLEKWLTLSGLRIK